MFSSRQAFPSTIALSILIPALAWVSVYVFNQWLFAATKWSEGIDWVFLPAAVRLISVLVFGPLGALGLFFGGVVTMMVVESAAISKALPIAAASAMAPLLAITVLMRLLQMQPTLMGMSSAQLAAMAAGSAATSAALHNFYYWLSSHRTDPMSGLLPMFVGDIVGTVLVFYILRSLLRTHARLRLPRQP